MSQYSKSENEPESLPQMMRLMRERMTAPPIADPTSIATERIFRIYMDMKSKVVLSDRSPEIVLAALQEARARTEAEVVVVNLREAAVTRYDLMIQRLTAGGEVQI